MRNTGPPHGQDGITLVELLVAMAISMVVLFATLQSLDLFTSQTARQTRVTDANAQVRATMDRVVRDLRGAAAVTRANPTDLVYTVDDPPGRRTERLCVSATNSLYGSSNTSSSTPATACGTLGSGWTGGKVATLDSSSATAFTYDGASTVAAPAKVRAVGLTFSLDAVGGGSTDRSTLIASAVVRRTAGTLPLTGADIRAQCNPAGALLDLGVAIDPQNPLTVTYAGNGGIQLGTGGGPTSSLQIPTGVTDVVATVTDAAGVTDTIRKTIECT